MVPSVVRRRPQSCIPKRPICQYQSQPQGRAGGAGVFSAKSFIDNCPGMPHRAPPRTAMHRVARRTRLAWRRMTSIVRGAAACIGRLHPRVLLPVLLLIHRRPRHRPVRGGRHAMPLVGHRGSAANSPVRLGRDGRPVAARRGPARALRRNSFQFRLARHRLQVVSSPRSVAARGGARSGAGHSVRQPAPRPAPPPPHLSQPAAGPHAAPSRPRTAQPRTHSA